MLSPRQRGTVHPYTSDQLTVAELQAVTPLECVEKMIAHQFSRKSKRRDILLEVQALLVEADAKMKKEDDVALRQSVGSRHLPSASFDDGLVTPSASAKWTAFSNLEQSSANTKASIDAETLRKIVVPDNIENDGSCLVPLPLQSSLINSSSPGHIASSPQNEGFTTLHLDESAVQSVSSPASAATESVATIRHTSRNVLVKQPQKQLAAESSPSFPQSGLSSSPPLTGGKRPRGGKTGQKLDLSSSTKRAVVNTSSKGLTKAVAVDSVIVFEPDLSESGDDEEEVDCTERVSSSSTVEAGAWESTISKQAFHVVEEMVALSLVQQLMPIRMDDFYSGKPSVINTAAQQQPPVVLVVLAPESVIEKGFRVPKAIPGIAARDADSLGEIPILSKVYNSSSEMLTSARLAFASGQLREARAIADARKNIRKLEKLMRAPHFGISGHIAASLPLSPTFPRHPFLSPSFVLSEESAIGLANVDDDSHEDQPSAPELSAATSIVMSSLWEPLSDNIPTRFENVANLSATALVLFLKHHTENNPALRSKNLTSSNGNAVRWGEALPPLLSFLPLAVRIVASRLGLGVADFPIEEHSVAIAEAMKGHHLMQFVTNAVQGTVACLPISGRQRQGPAYAPLASVPVVLVARRVRTPPEALSASAQRINAALLKNSSRPAVSPLPNVQDISEALFDEVKRQWAHALSAVLGRATMPSATGEVYIAKSLIRDAQVAFGCRDFILGDEASPSLKFEGLALSFTIKPLHS
jgi:hypothetical protein